MEQGNLNDMPDNAFEEFLRGIGQGRNLEIDGESLNIRYWASDILYDEALENIDWNFEEDFEMAIDCYYLQAGITSHIINERTFHLLFRHREFFDDRNIDEPTTFLEGLKVTARKFNITYSDVLIEPVLVLSRDLTWEDILIDSIPEVNPRFEKILSLSYFVRNEFEIKLSRTDSCIYKNGREYMDVFFGLMGWFIDLTLPGYPSYQGLKLAMPETIRKIIKQYREDCERDKAYEGVNSLFSLDEIDIERMRPVEENESIWVLDSGLAPGHIITTTTGLFNTRENSHMANLVKGCKLTGDIQLGNLLLENVLYFPNFKFNVISIRTLANKDYECYFTKEKATLTRDGETYLTAPMVGNLWIYNSVHERNGWLQNGCPDVLNKISSFEKQHWGEFSKNEIGEAFQSMAHKCELAGLWA